MEMSKGPRGQEGKHIPSSDNRARMEMSKGQADERESTYELATMVQGWR